MLAMLVALVFFTYVISLCSALLIIEFDGSWRPSPRDPAPGFRSAPVQACSASSSAALFLKEDESSADERLLAMGAKSLSGPLTSADAEYEGLLMGLEHLESLLLYHDSYAMEQQLIIRGDCKAVIDQLNSRSNPRKTEGYYTMAMEKIKRLRDRSSVIEIEHVGRENNILCDTLSKLVLNIEQTRVVESVQDVICMGEADSITKQITYTTNNVRKRSTKKKLFVPKSIHYAMVIEEIANCSRICVSSRLALACLLSKSAVRTQDVAILSQLSGFFLQSSRTIHKVLHSETTATATKETLRTLSILCEMLAMDFAGDKKGAEELQEKKRIILDADEDVIAKLNRNLDAIMEICTTNDKHEILFPYSEFTSELISGQKYSHQLRELSRSIDDVADLKLAVWLTNYS